MQKGIAAIVLLLVVLVIGGLVSGVFYFGRQTNPILTINGIIPGDGDRVSCTKEAKICPDGSAVGRVGPNCEFASCPTSDPSANWETYTSKQLGFTIQYPEFPNGTEIDESTKLIQFYEKKTTGPFSKSEFPSLQVSIQLKNTNKTAVDWIENESDISRLLKEEMYSDIEWKRIGNWYISSDTIATFGPEFYAYGFFDDKIVKITTTNSRDVLTQTISTFEFTQ